VNQSKANSYLPRKTCNKPNLAGSVLHPAVNPKIECTASYLPLHRTDPLHKRKPFDDRTARIGTVAVVIKGFNNAATLSKIVIGDLLDDTEFKTWADDEYWFHYDIRTDRITHSIFNQSDLAFVSSSEFRTLIAQVKFLDGMTDGYTEAELNGLRTWLQQNGVNAMQQFFSSTILKYRPESHFPHSQLWRLFQELQPAS
jgi:hypothetical protein